jgi:hypothetical protein
MMHERLKTIGIEIPCELRKSFVSKPLGALGTVMGSVISFDSIIRTTEGFQEHNYPKVFSGFVEVVSGATVATAGIFGLTRKSSPEHELERLNPRLPQEVTIVEPAMLASSQQESPSPDQMH